MGRLHFNRCVWHHWVSRMHADHTAQLMLQTAPVMLLFHPTTGPHARADKPMERLDFNTGYVFIASIGVLVKMLTTPTQHQQGRTGPPMAIAQPPRPTTSPTRSPDQLCQDSCDDNSGPWSHHILDRRCAIRPTDCAESQSLGCNQPYCCSAVHQRTYVQPYSQSAIRVRRRQGWRELLRWRVSESVRAGDSDRSCNV